MQQRTWLGVTVVDGDSGVTIVGVNPNSPAQAAQLQADDVIMAVNSTSITSAADLQAMIDAAASGDVVTLTIERGSDQLSVDVTLSSRGGGRGQFAPLSDPLQAAEFALHVQIEEVDGSYQVVAVDDNSPFALQVGDVITAINDTAIELGRLDDAVNSAQRQYRHPDGAARRRGNLGRGAAFVLRRSR